MNTGPSLPASILLVEEDSILRDTLRIGLRSYWAGCVVEAPGDMRKVVQLLKQTGSALVILDIDPDDSIRWQVPTDIRKASDAPVLLLGAVAREVKERMQALGVADYMTKPFGHQALVRCTASNAESVNRRVR